MFTSAVRFTFAVHIDAINLTLNTLSCRYNPQCPAELRSKMNLFINNAAAMDGTRELVPCVYRICMYQNDVRKATQGEHAHTHKKQHPLKLVQYCCCCEGARSRNINQLAFKRLVLICSFFFCVGRALTCTTLQSVTSDGGGLSGCACVCSCLFKI